MTKNMKPPIIAITSSTERKKQNKIKVEIVAVKKLKVKGIKIVNNSSPNC